jgi:hypothetical protein
MDSRCRQADKLKGKEGYRSKRPVREECRAVRNSQASFLKTLKDN